MITRCCVIMLAASLVLIFLSQTPVEASKSRPYCENSANKCCELHTSQCEAQNEKFDVINEKLKALNQKLEDHSKKLEDQNENLKDQNEKINEKLEDLKEKFETLIKQKQEQEKNCKLEHDGELKEAIMVTNTTAPVNISVWGSATCTLRVLAVGGGGGI